MGRPAWALVLACGLALAVGGSPGGAAATAKGPPPPNVVVVMSDDQTVEQMRVMSEVQSAIADQGATFENEFDNYSLCCPSRATFLTGLYAHNHHVLSNAPPAGGFERFEALNSNNDLPLWLQSAGYYTGQVGKYLNGYGDADPTLIPPGWNELAAVSGAVDFYDYSLNENGTLVSYGEDPANYVDDVITGKAVDFIQRRAPEASPFFLYVAYKSPHAGGPYLSGTRCAGGPEPAPRHFGTLEGEALPMPPSFNEADVSDKPTKIQNLPLLDDAAIAALTERYRCELEAVLGVDDGVKAIMDALGASGELDNTFVIYTSDNGYFHGEHRVNTGKVRVYEPSIRVPLVMRGPGIPAGTTVNDLTINADLAPTIVGATGAVANRAMDGESLLRAVQHPAQRRGRELLIETQTYAAIRTHRYLYTEYNDGEKELYDLIADPDELQNVVDTAAYAAAQAALAADLTSLRDCDGADCHRVPHLALSLHYRHRHVHHGPLCSKSPVSAKITGADAARLELAGFTLNGEDAGQASAAPFKVTLPDAALHHGRHNRVHALIDLIDGRELTLDAGFPPACR